MMKVVGKLLPPCLRALQASPGLLVHILCLVGASDSSLHGALRLITNPGKERQSVC